LAAAERYRVITPGRERRPQLARLSGVGEFSGSEINGATARLLRMDSLPAANNGPQAKEGVFVGHAIEKR